MIYLKMIGTETELQYAIEEPIFVMRQSNGMVLRCPAGRRAQGLLSPDSTEIWQLADRDSLGEGYPLVEQVTMAEYDEWYAIQNQPEVPDPEDTDPVIPEDTEPTTVLTRAELTEKVRQLEQELEAAKALLGLNNEQ